MIEYNEFDLKHYNEVLEPILEWLEIDVPTDDEVWCIGRQREDIPIFENILMGMCQLRLGGYLDEHFEGVEYEFWLNAYDTHFNFNGREIKDLDDFKEVLEEFEMEAA